MASRSQLQPVAIALVLQDDDGTMHIIGSKDIDSFMIEMTLDVDTSFFDHSRRMQPRKNFRFEADCSSTLWQVTTPVPLPRQIEQRGIYLPDMSFRALPGPTDE